MTTREALAALLASTSKVEARPEWLKQNYSDYRNGKNYGFAFSWYCWPDHWSHPLYDTGSTLPMKEFLKLAKDSPGITILHDELYPTPKEQKP